MTAAYAVPFALLTLAVAIVGGLWPFRGARR